MPTKFLAPSTDLPTNVQERKYVTLGGDTLTKSLEWTLRYCLMAYLFDRSGQVRKEFVKEKRRGDLVDGLKRRFVFMGCLNLLFSPFIVVYLLIYSFFRYFEVRPYLTLSSFIPPHTHLGALPLLYPDRSSVFGHIGLPVCPPPSASLICRNTIKIPHP
jgi:hypothetical protein